MHNFGKQQGGGRRSAARMTAPLTAVITTLRESRSAILVDISATGAKLRGSDLPGPSEELFLTVDGVIAFGSVAWANNSDHAIVFDAPLKRSDEARLKRKVAEASGLSPEPKPAFDLWARSYAR
jgi:hypothetical protein